MASNREERKLMRQRGAASRKVKDVNFGFSFGSPTGHESPLQSLGLRALSQTSSPSSRLSLPSISLSQRTPVRDVSQASSSGVRTPGSLRNHLPERPSVFDIPVDDEPQTRSAKRRKLSPPKATIENGELTVEHPQAAVAHDSEAPGVNGGVESTIPPKPTSPAALPVPPKFVSPVNEGPDGDAPTIPEAEDVNEPVPDDGDGDEGSIDEGEGSSQQPKPLKRKRKKRKSVLLKPSRPKRPSANPSRQPPEAQPPTVDRPPDIEQNVERSGEEPPADTSQHRVEPSAEPEASEDRTESTAERKGKRKADAVQNQILPVRRRERSAQALPESREAKGVPSAAVHAGQGEEEEVAEEQANATGQGPRKKRRKGKETAKSLTSTTRERSSERQAPSERPRREESSPVGAETDQRAPAATRGRLPSREPREEDAQEERPQVSKKQRQPRGETVPVVVHRLANISALDVDLEDLPEDEQQPSRDAHAREKYPTRGGANAADVLGQICSETLEKTMATLDNSISQESNPGRRAEWTRKRKAVEAFNKELSHRLFELSDIMESNFVLAAQLKKEKKEMASLRNRLMEVRKQRGDIALEIDAVRRNHAEDERASREQNSLNNALHDLQLALGRTRKGKESDADSDPFVGLEFLLRTVAGDVSSLAPDSHGGLLRQVQSFNAQLERAASLLDQKR